MDCSSPIPFAPRFRVDLLALVPDGDDHRIALVRWIGHDLLGLEGAPDLGGCHGRAIEVCLPDPWDAPPLRLRAVFRWAHGERVVAHVAGADDAEHSRWARLVEAAGEGRLVDRRQLPRPGANERRDHARYRAEGLAVRLDRDGAPLELTDIGEGGFSVRGRLTAGPPVVFEITGDARWPGLPLWVAGQVVRSGARSGVRLLAPNFSRFLALVRQARVCASARSKSARPMRGAA